MMEPTLDNTMIDEVADSTSSDLSEMDQAYNTTFTDDVHKWGRLSMVIATILSYAPIIYMYLFAGWRAPITSYLSVALAISTIGISMWLTEPLSYFPILGSAGTYMAYLAGNVGSMRVPVSVSVQSALKTNVTTPKGNIATILGIGMSVFTNLAVLTVVILLSDVVVNALPAVVKESFQYVLPALYGSLIIMQILNNPKAAVKYMTPAFVLFFLLDKIPQVAYFAMALNMLIIVVYAYFLNKYESKKTGTTAS